MQFVFLFQWIPVLVCCFTFLHDEENKTKVSQSSNNKKILKTKDVRGKKGEQCYIVYDDNNETNLLLLSTVKLI